MTPKPKRKITVASADELRQESYINRLWLAARNEPYSCLIWPEALTSAIKHFNGVIVMPDGRLWPIPDIDDVMGDPRWISNWFEERNGKPRRKPIMLERLRLIDLYFRIEYPNIARHFSR